MMDYNSMTKFDVEERITKIAANAIGDWEFAHSMEDDLMRDALQAIAMGYPEPDKLAALVLTTGDIAFPRVCA